MEATVAFLVLVFMAIGYTALNRRDAADHVDDLRDQIETLEGLLEEKRDRIERLEEQIDDLHAKGLTVTPGPARASGGEAEETITLPDAFTAFLQDISDDEGRREIAAWMRRRIRQNEAILEDEELQASLLEELVTS